MDKENPSYLDKGNSVLLNSGLSFMSLRIICFYLIMEFGFGEIFVKKMLYYYRKFENRSHIISWYCSRSLSQLRNPSLHMGKDLRKNYILQHINGYNMCQQFRSKSVNGIKWCFTGLCYLVTCILQFEPINLKEWKST